VNQLFGLGASLLVALAVAGCGSGTAESRAQKLKDPYPAKVEKRDLEGYAFLDDPALYVPPESQAVVYPKYKAPVEQVMAAVGQRVNRGEVLIQLSFPSADAAYDQAQADLKAAETAYANAKSQYEQPVREAKAALDQARRIERDARAQTDPTGDASMVEQARMQREAAEAAVKEAQIAADANSRSYRDQLDAYRQAMDQAKQGVKQGSLRAPISGTVTFLDVRAGEVVGDNASRPLVKIVDLGDIQVKAHVASSYAEKLEKGKMVTVAFKELPDRTFEGRISKVAVVPTGQGESAKELTIDFRNDEGLIKEGFHPDWAGIKVGEVKDVLVVPRLAVDLDSTGKPVVKVLDGQNWVPRVVETGLSDGKFIEIKSGLKEGETVQVTPEERVEKV
jgi:RND family efflux transporter MFP subunit